MDMTTLIQEEAAHPLFLVSIAMLVGALHGLEPGHSKTMIAAYIIAIRGSFTQAFLLGISAAISHSLVIWILAAIALSYGHELIGEALEPWFMILSGFLIILLALWMVKPLWIRFLPIGKNHLHHKDLLHEESHLKAHARRMNVQLANQNVGTMQTILFGLTGGLLPCPGAITVFLVCVQLDQVSLGVILVGAFSLGLAIILVVIGCIAALGLKMVSDKGGLFHSVTAYAPFFSSLLVALIGGLLIVNGYTLLDTTHHPH